MRHRMAICTTLGVNQARLLPGWQTLPWELTLNPHSCATLVYRQTRVSRHRAEHQEPSEALAWRQAHTIASALLTLHTSARLAADEICILQMCPWPLFPKQHHSAACSCLLSLPTKIPFYISPLEARVFYWMIIRKYPRRLENLKRFEGQLKFRFLVAKLSSRNM